MAPSFLVGTSGFSYPHWRHGVFYPEGLPVAAELAYYATRFATVELNNPFYRLPERSVFAAWRRAAPADFVFAVKASRYITHNKKLKDPAPALARLRRSLEGLGDSLGPVLFQLPPNFGPNLPRLETFLADLPRAWRPVFEFRHPGWFTSACYALLRRRSAALCWAVSPQAPEPPREITAPFIYLRMHGGRGRDANFTPAELRRWAQRLRDAAVPASFVYFNNDWRGFAPANARDLAALLRRRAAA